MAKRTTRTMSDTYTKALAPEAKPARVSFIQNGIKYKSGVAPTRVSLVAAPTRNNLATPLR